MTAATATLPARAHTTTSPGVRLAMVEIGRYARNPLFLVGLILTVLTTAAPEAGETRNSHLLTVLIPALFLGIFGLMVMYQLTRRSDRLAAAAGSPTVGMRTRTAALAATVVVPVTAALVWFAWTVQIYLGTDTPADGLPFGGVGDSWAIGTLFALGVVSCAGGPILGLVLARWFPRRGISVIAVIVLIIATVLMQGIIEPLRYIRVIMPFTWFGNQYGVEGDPERYVILTGSPQWYSAYLIALCVLGVLMALYRDPEPPRRNLRIAIGVVATAAVVLCLLAMTTGVQEVMVNPVPSAFAVSP